MRGSFVYQTNNIEAWPSARNRAGGGEGDGLIEVGPDAAPVAGDVDRSPASDNRGDLEGTARMARLLNEFPEIIIVANAHGELIWSNERAEKLFGRTLNETIGMSVIEFVHPDDLEIVLRSFETVQGKEIGNPLEIRVLVASEWRLLEIIGVPVGWYEPGAILFSLRDLTDRRRFEVSRDDVARFRSLVHNATAIMLFLSPEGLIRSASGALTRQLGHDPEVVENEPLANLVLAEDRPALAGAIEVALRTSSAAHPVIQAVRMLHHGSSNLSTDFELSIVSLMDDPTVQGLVVTANDVSARVRAESDLQRALLDTQNTTSLLNATLNSTADGLLVVNRDRSIRSYNSQFAWMWLLPDSLMTASDDVEWITYILDQLVDPDAFLARVEELYATPESESHDIIHFKDGRVFDRYSKPQYMASEVVGRVWSFSDITDQKRLEGQLSHLAFHDTLTGLANRALFRDRLSQAIARSDRSGKYVAVMFLDLDRFKDVNDSLGHSIGDELLKSVAESLTGCVRRSDTAARLGGDEFAILIEDVDNHDEVMELANRIMDALRRPVTLGGQPVCATVSIGISFGLTGSTSDELLRNADLAMYLAKANGRDRYEEFRDHMHNAVATRLELEADLRRAVNDKEFIVHYQPIVNLETGRFVAFEALVRWDHPTRGVLAPDLFVPFAEEIGLISAIDSLVLEETCCQIRQWQYDGLLGPEVEASVNLSRRDLLDPTLADRVASTLRTTGFDPRHLILEVTESAVLHDVDAAERSLQALKALGLRLAIDNFGTGYSSFSLLERLPVDILKIDRVFTASMANQENRQDLIDVILQLTRALGLDAIVEGVEHRDQAQRLRDLGCVYAQGFHLAPPQEAIATGDVLRQHTMHFGPPATKASHPL